MSEHELRLGDCLDPLTGLASLADKSVDHVICDPPYSAKVHSFAQTTATNNRRRDLGFVAITAGTRTPAAAEIARATRRWVLVFCDAEGADGWRADLVSAGLRYVRTCAWMRHAGPQVTGDRPGAGYEAIVVAHADRAMRWNAGGRSGVWEFQTQESDRQHPTPKPLALMEALISDFTDPGELICDPFAGSGTTLVACKRLGRRAIGWEKDATFWERAVRRLENTKQQYELLPRGPKPKQVKMVLP